MATNGYMLTPVDESISKDKSFECCICHGLLRDAVETPCGHAFCKLCLAQWEQTRINQLLEMKCPLCNENYDVDKVRRIVTINKYIKGQLKVYCLKSDSGCKWQGTIDDFEEHESDECLYAVIDCPHEGCDDSAPRHEIDSHAKDTCVYRNYECKYCNEVHTFIEVELGDHWEKSCLDAPVHCSNEKCDEKLTRGKLEDHLARHCPFERTACPFMEVGCLTKVEREKIDTHISSHSDHHSKMLLHSFITIRDILTDTKTELEKTKESLEETKEGLAETKEELQESKKKLQDTKEELSGVKLTVFLQLLKKLKCSEEEDYAEKFDELVDFMEQDVYYKVKNKYYVKVSYHLDKEVLRIYIDDYTRDKNVDYFDYCSNTNISLLPPEAGWHFNKTTRAFIHPKRPVKIECDGYGGLCKDVYTEYLTEENFLLIIMFQK